MKWITIDTGINPEYEWIEVELKDGTVVKAQLNYWHSSIKECRCENRLNRCEYILNNQMVRWRGIESPYPTPFSKG